jgi:hypothetical protein
MALPAHSGPRPLIQFRNHSSQAVGPLGRVISPSQGRYLHTGQHKHRINAHTDIHALSGIRDYDPSVRASEDSSCLRPRGYCDLSRDPFTLPVSPYNVLSVLPPPALSVSGLRR